MFIFTFSIQLPIIKSMRNVRRFFNADTSHMLYSRSVLHTYYAAAYLNPEFLYRVHSDALLCVANRSAAPSTRTCYLYIYFNYKRGRIFFLRLEMHVAYRTIL